MDRDPPGPGATGGSIMMKRRLLGLALGLAAAVAVGLILPVGKTPARPDAPKAKAEEVPGKGKRAKEVVAAFNKGHAQALAAFWPRAGDYVDEPGRRGRGRRALEKMDKKVSAGRKGAKLAVTVTSARLVPPDVALEGGLSEVTPPDGGPPAVARFSAVLVKK